VGLAFDNDDVVFLGLPEDAALSAVGAGMAGVAEVFLFFLLVLEVSYSVS
jgi:hypothetical protein